MNAKETNIRRRLPTTTGDQNLPFCKYHIYSSLRTDLNFNGDNSLTFKRTLQVNKRFVHSLQDSLRDVSASNHTAKRKHGDPMKRARQHSQIVKIR